MAGRLADAAGIQRLAGALLAASRRNPLDGASRSVSAPMSGRPYSFICTSPAADDEEHGAMQRMVLAKSYVLFRSLDPAGSHATVVSGAGR
jgi:imidazoleglycerol phosphate dehydratase HisB